MGSGSNDDEMDAGGRNGCRVGAVARVVRAEQRVREALVELEPVAHRRRVEAEHVGERESLARRTTVLPVQDGNGERPAAHRPPVHLERAVVAVVPLLAAALRQFVNLDFTLELFVLCRYSRTFQLESSNE